MICVAGIGDRKGFGCLATNMIPSIDLAFEKTQCFPFYIYDEDGSNRRGEHHRLGVGTIPRSLPSRVHRQMGHLPLRLRAPASPRLSGSGIRQTSSGIYPACHTHRTFGTLPKRVNDWEKSISAMREASEYPLHFIENRDVPINPSPRLRGRGLWRVEKMKLSKDKTQLIYNDFLTL